MQSHLPSEIPPTLSLLADLAPLDNILVTRVFIKILDLNRHFFLYFYTLRNLYPAQPVRKERTVNFMPTHPLVPELSRLQISGYGTYI